MISNALGFIPQNLPSLNLDFTQGVLNPALSFSRSSEATYYDPNGVVRTAAVNVPRFDYDPISKQLLGLMIEEQRTNINLNTISGWSKGPNTIKAVDTTTAPDGSQVPLWTNIPSLNSTLGMTTSGGFLNSTTYTRSLYVKCISSNNSANKRWFFETTLGNVSNTYANANFNLTNVASATAFGAPSTARIVDVGNGWYRLIQTFTTDASGTPGMTQNYLMGYGSSPDTGTFAVWGAQLEVGPFATSYIPTAGMAVTRSADVCSMSTSGWFNQNVGTFWAEWRGGRSSGQDYRGCVASFNGIQNAIIGAAGLGSIESWNGTQGGTWNTSIDFTAQFIKTAIGYDNLIASKTLSLQGNSNLLVTNNYSGSYGGNTLYIGSRVSSSQFLNGYIRKLIYYPRRLSNTYLQALTL